MVSLRICSIKVNTPTHQVPLLDRSAPFMDDIVVSKDGVTKLLKGLVPYCYLFLLIRIYTLVHLLCD